jgi:hypothetical protein
VVPAAALPREALTFASEALMPSTARFPARLELQHTCAACGCVFRYPVPAALSGVPPFAADPHELARRRRDHVRRNLLMAVRAHPCPHCGFVQRDMTAWTMLGHLLGFLIGFFALLALAGLSTALEGGLPSLGTLTWAGLVAFTVVAVIHLASGLLSFNTDPEANRARARQEAAAGKVRLVKPGKPLDEVSYPRHVTAAKVVPLALAAAAPAAFLYPLLHPGNRVPVPTNPRLHPAIVCPGAEVKYRLTGLSEQGIGIYRGQPVVRVLNARELGCPGQLTATGSDEKWDDTLEVDRECRNSPMEPEIAFTVPPDDALAGTTLRLEVTMDMTYAVLNYGMAGSMGFSNGRATVSNTLEVKVAPLAYSRDLRGALQTALGGAAVSVLAGLCLCLLLPRQFTAEVVPDGPDEEAA